MKTLRTLIILLESVVTSVEPRSRLPVPYHVQTRARHIMPLLNVLLFARARELAETSSTTLTLPDDPSATVADARAELLTRFPQLSGVLQTSIFALNKTYVKRDDERVAIVRAGDELAVVPPISGG